MVTPIIETTFFIEQRAGVSSEVRSISAASSELRCVYLNPQYFGPLDDEGGDTLHFTVPASAVPLPESSMVYIRVTGRLAPERAELYDPWASGMLAVDLSKHLFHQAEGAPRIIHPIAQFDLGASDPPYTGAPRERVCAIELSGAFVTKLRCDALDDRPTNHMLQMSLLMRPNGQAALKGSICRCIDGQLFDHAPAVQQHLQLSSTPTMDQPVLDMSFKFRAKRGPTVSWYRDTGVQCPIAIDATEYTGVLPNEALQVLRSRGRTGVTVFCKIPPRESSDRHMIEALIGAMDDAASIYGLRVSTLFAE